MCESYLNQEVKDTRVQCFGEGVACVTRLLHIQGHVNGLQGTAPFAVHLATGQLLLQTILVDTQQKGREGQNWKRTLKEGSSNTSGMVI